MKIRTMYLRDASGSPVGAVAITVNRGQRRISYQISVVHPADTRDASGRRLPFDSRRARLMALERLIESPVLVPIKSGATMHDISEKVMKHMASSDAPARARKFAKMWLASDNRQ